MKYQAALIVTLLSMATQALRAEPALTVFAAASLQGVLEDVAATQNESVVHSYGGSGTIARQIAAGAPADLVILANPVWMDWLVSQPGIPRTVPVNVAGNGLAVVGPVGAAPLTDPAEIPVRLETGRLAMGQPQSVPAGTYARQWLRAIGLWPKLQGHLAETDNVRAALAFVARNEAPLGIVYITDALADPAVDNVYTVPSDSHDPIRYPALALSDRGLAYLTHLTGTQAQRIFNAYGFKHLHDN